MTMTLTRRRNQVRGAILKGVGAVLLLYFLLFFGLADVGLLGPDEPRYASIGREMFFTGDWVTPVLWGEAWFEKPILLYWLTGSAYSAGLSEDLAPRLPVATLSALFLVFFWWWTGRQFGRSAGWHASLILATTAGWFAFSRIGVTDLPLAVFFGASMLLAMEWAADDNRRVLFPAGVLLGVAVLAKGLVPIVLSLPLLWFGRRRLKDLAGFYGFAAMAAAPWYVLCALENGVPFLHEFFWRHHFGRFASGELRHVQPFWFYLPVLLAGLLPWTPVLLLSARKSLFEDRRPRFLLAIVLFGLLFFSASANKLPGYLLPLFPPLAAVLGVALSRTGHSSKTLTSAALLLAAFPLAAEILPGALQRGITLSAPTAVNWLAALPFLAVVGAVWLLERKGKRLWAMAGLAAGVAGGVVYVVLTTFPVLDREVSARALWEAARPQSHIICVEEIHRSWRYGLNYYSLEPLPSCLEEDQPLHIRQTDGQPAFLTPR